MFCKENIHNIISLLTLNFFLLSLYALVHYVLWRHGLSILDCC